MWSERSIEKCMEALAEFCVIAGFVIAIAAVIALMCE